MEGSDAVTRLTATTLSEEKATAINLSDCEDVGDYFCENLSLLTLQGELAGP